MVTGPSVVPLQTSVLPLYVQVKHVAVALWDALRDLLNLDRLVDAKGRHVGEYVAPLACRTTSVASEHQPRKESNLATMPSTVSEMVVSAVIAAPHPLTCHGEFSQEVDSNHSTLA